MKKKLADVIDMDSVSYSRVMRTRTDKAVVTLSSSNGTLWFNPKMVNILDMAGWKQVLVGYSRENDIIVLKNVDVEEYGSVKVHILVGSKKDTPQTTERYKHCRKVCIATIIKNLSITTSKAYRAERDGSIIFLRDVDHDE